MRMEKVRVRRGVGRARSRRRDAAMGVAECMLSGIVVVGMFGRCEASVVTFLHVLGSDSSRLADSTIH